MASNQELEIHRRGATLERVAEWEQHRDLSGVAKRQVLGALVRLPQNPSESQTDKLLDLVGSHHRATLRTVLPKDKVTAIIGERHDRYTVEDLVADFGVDPVHTAFDYAKAVGASKETEDAPSEYNPVIILGAAKLAATYGLANFEEVSEAVEHYSAENGIDSKTGFEQLTLTHPEEVEAQIGRPLA
jgi:hypothetical protein